MKGLYLAVFLILFNISALAVFAEDSDAASPATNETEINSGNSYKNLYLFLNLDSGTLLSGTAYNYLNYNLTPTPDSIGSIGAGAGIDWYFLEYLGISLSGDYYGISANASSYALSFCTGYTIKAMLIGRIPFKPFINRDDKFMGLALRFFAGPNYTTFDLTSQFKTLVENSLPAGSTITWYTGPALGLGYTAGMGIQFEYNHIGCGLDFYVQYQNIKYSESPSSLDWLEFGEQFRICFGF